MVSAKKIKPNSFSIINKSLKQHISEMHGNITTTSGFGKRLFSNFIRNFSLINEYTKINQINKSILITGSGPGLNKDIEFIKKHRDNFFIIGLPSSLVFLKHNSVKVDCIISTDPGYFAKNHLHGFEAIPLIIPFYASIPLNSFASNIIPVSGDYFLETKLLKHYNDFLKVPSNGTVAGSALFAALNLTSSYIFFTGLDFSFVDCLSHIRPHSFDTLLESKANRKNTINSIYFNRNIVNSEKINSTRRITKSLETYKGWFSSISENLKERAFFIDYATNTPGSFKSLNYSQVIKLINNKNQETVLTKKQSLFLVEKKY